MKTLNIFFVLVSIFCFSHAGAQVAFSGTSLNKVNDRNSISFSVPSETNVFQYRVLGGNDSAALAVIGTIHPSGSSMLTKKYIYPVYDTPLAYYRIQVVGMDAKIRSSSLITTNANRQPTPPVINNQYDPNGSIVLQRY